MDRQKKLWNKYLIMFMFIGFAASIPMQVYNATLSLYVSYLGGSAKVVGTILVVFTIATIIARIVSGSFTDTMGRRIVAYVGLLVFAVATFSYTVLPFIAAVFVLRGLQGIGYGTSNTAISTAATDVIPHNRMGEGLGYYSLCMSVSTAIGPAIGLALVAGDKFFNAFLFSTIALVSAMVVLFFANHEKKSCLSQIKDYKIKKAAVQTEEVSVEKLSFIDRYVEKEALPAAITQFFFSFAIGFVVNFLTLYADKYGLTNAGLFFTLEAVAMIVARLAFSRFADTLPGLFVMLPCVAVSIGGFILLIMAPSNPGLLLIAGVMYGAGAGCILPFLNAEAVRHVPLNRRGVASSNFYLGLDVGIGVGGFIWGVVIDSAIGFVGAIWGAIIAMLVALTLYVLLVNRKKRQMSN